MTIQPWLRALLAAAVATAIALAPATARAQRRKDGKPTRPSKVDYKLKKGATGTLCLDCHTDFSALVNKRSVHTPVKTRKCIGCHSPHASNHGALLEADSATICDTCHAGVIPAQATVRHGPARDGKCTKCHDVHAADNPSLLSKSETDTCAGCHGDVVRAAANATRKHRPLEKDGCTSCHDPHASTTAFLLKKPVQQLCADCHKVEQRWFAKMHNGYPASVANCTSCHAPHGSSQRAMLHASVHEPVAKGACGKCHDEATRQGPPTTKKRGRELCRTCHNQRIKSMFGKARVHWAVLADRECTNCHNPHASSQPKLLAARPARVCGTCHADTVRRYERSPTKHEPVADDCGECHDPHSSDNVLMLTKSDSLELCGTCHDWRKHSSHPVGKQLKDPRSPNLSMSCLSCHRSHGTEHQHLLPTATTTELCVQCHENFRR